MPHSGRHLTSIQGNEHKIMKSSWTDDAQIIILKHLLKNFTETAKIMEELFMDFT